MDEDRFERGLAGAALGSLVAVFVAAALVGIRGEIANANVALILVMCVLLGAVIGGRVGGVTTAVAAAMSFDFFHTQPYNSLKISNGNDLVTTLLLLLVGLGVGEVAYRWRVARVARDDEVRQLRRIDRIGGLVSAGEDVDDLVLAVCAELTETLRLRACHFERPPYNGSFPRMGRRGIVITKHHWYTPTGFELPRDGVELAVVGAGEEIGRFVLAPTPGFGVSSGRRTVAVALADQLGSALAHRVA